MRNIIVTIKNGNGEIIAIDEIALPGDSVDGMTATITTMSRPRRSSQERNPLHPRALILADIHAGCRIRIHYTGLRMDIKDFSAIVTEEPFTNDEGDFIVPFMEEDGNQSQWLAADMGLAPYGENWDSPVTWTPLWYVTAEH